MKKVLFLFPPYLPGASKSPYLAPHLLTTLLRQKGHEVENLDINNQFIRRMASPRVVDAVEKHFESMLSDSSVDKTDKFFILGSITHLRMLREKRNNGETIPYEALVTHADNVRAHTFHNIKTITDYRDNGLNVLPCIREELKQMVDDLDLEGRTVCMSCAFGDQLPFTLEIARLIKVKSPKTQIILGGAQVSLLPEKLINELQRFKLFNMVFTGFAEEKISEAVESCTDEYFTTPMTGSTATSKMLDALPFTEFDHMECYDNPLIPVMVNKGCYWGKCSFCDYILMGDLGGFRYISRSVDIVFNEIKSLRSRYPDYRVNLISDAVPPKFYKELAIKANTESFPLRTYSYMINNKNLTEEFFMEASKAQIGMIVFGTESTSDRILEKMQKQGRRADILENFRLARKYGVNIKVNLIPNYPTTTYEEALQTIEDVKEFQDSISLLAVFKFYLSANTTMDKDPEKFELEVDPDLPYVRALSNGYHSREFVNKKAMTKQQEDEVYLKLRNIDFMCHLNEIRRKFKVLWDERNMEGLTLSSDFKLLSDNGAYMVYSFKTGRFVYISEDDYKIISALQNNKLSFAKLRSILGKSDYLWLEKYFFFEVFEYEKATRSAISA